MDRENKVLQGYRCWTRSAIEFSECPKKGASALPGDQDMKIAKTQKALSNKGFMNSTLRNKSAFVRQTILNTSSRGNKGMGESASVWFLEEMTIIPPLAEGWWKNRDQDENWKWITGQLGELSPNPINRKELNPQTLFITQEKGRDSQRRYCSPSSTRLPRNNGAVVLTHPGGRVLAWHILSNPQQYPMFWSSLSLIKHHPLGFLFPQESVLC